MPLINKNAVEIAELGGVQFYPLAELPEALPSPAGLLLAPDADLAALPQELQAFAVIAVEFPKFRDGRGFTHARTLRQRGYQGDIRAVGHFLPDQFLALQACGFSSFVTPAEHPPAQFAAMLTNTRQPGQSLRRSLLRVLETT